MSLIWLRHSLRSRPSFVAIPLLSPPHPAAVRVPDPLPNVVRATMRVEGTAARAEGVPERQGTAPAAIHLPCIIILPAILPAILFCTTICLWVTGACASHFCKFGPSVNRGHGVTWRGKRRIFVGGGLFCWLITTATRGAVLGRDHSYAVFHRNCRETVVKLLSIMAAG